ncbi:response regulator [Herbaspirillum sp. alder98]|uniref:response regulator n=1 Tax=Herbaspirillum sp. alder98 TaxID=2913096 RepID=UPI001CD87678|nr:response regulator [Herbaspirillum sp. alder98]MCA1324109.1 response regulator [Herbaspirillum sp. alder98]
MNLPTIVMIDSSPEAAEMVRFALWKSNLRCTFKVYADAAAAARCMLQQRRRASDEPAPALVLLESDLDYTDGLDVLRDLRADARFAEVPVVVFPSYDMEGSEAAFAAGATEYRPKPVDAELYVRTIAEFYHRWCVGSGSNGRNDRNDRNERMPSASSQHPGRRRSDRLASPAQCTKPPLMNLIGSASMAAMSRSRPC